MSQLFVDADLIEKARGLADRVAGQIQARIDENTTVSVERTVLRFFGIEGTGNSGAPMANLIVDRLQQAGVLGKGAAWWLGRALYGGASDPLAALDRTRMRPFAGRCGPRRPRPPASSWRTSAGVRR
jgi:beta-lysine 5,6-aminomutase alpha subunit